MQESRIYVWMFVLQDKLQEPTTAWGRWVGINGEYGQASRKISTGRLNTLPHLDRQPINQIFSLVPLGASRPCVASS